MFRYRRTIEIARPPEDVFAFLTNLESLPRWQPTVRDVRWDGELHEGSQFEETRELLGRRARSRVEVVTVDPGREFTIRVVEGPVALHVRHLLQSVEGGTQLTLEAEGEAEGLMRLATPIAERAAARQAIRDLERLKRLVEEMK